MNLGRTPVGLGFDVIADRENRGEHYGYTVYLGELRHGCEIALNFFESHGPGISRDVIGAR